MKTASAVVRKNKKTAISLNHENVSSASRASILAMAALVVVVAACYANSLSNGFVFDDNPVIVENRLLRSIDNLPKVLFASYRPTRDVSHMADFALWGENPWGFHLTNVVIHTVNALLVFWLIRRLSGSLLIAGLAGLIFAAHPIQTDAVTYISGRRDILFSLFYLASFHAYLSYRGSRGANNKKAFAYFALFIAMWGLSLMSKEMAVTLPAVIFVWNFCDGWSNEISAWWKRFLNAARAAFSRDKWLYMALSVAGAAFVYYSVFIKGGSILARDGFKYWGGSFYTNMLMAIRVHAWYLKQLVFPTPIVQYKGAFDISTTILDWRVLLSIAVVGAVLAAGIYSLNRSKLVAFAILSYFILLLPVSQIIPHHELLADHYLYLPMMSFGLLVGVALYKISERGEPARKIAYAAAGCLIVAFGVMTILRNPVWKDDMSVWETNYREVPNSIRAASSLARLYTNINPNKSEELYRRCVEIDPSYAPAYYSLAVLGRTKEKATDAERIIQQGLALPDSKVISASSPDPREFRAQLKTALGLIKMNQGEFERGELLLQEAINIYPLFPPPYTLLANYYQGREPEKAMKALQRLVAVFPTHRQALEQLSTFLIQAKRYDEAVPHLEEIRKSVADDFYANYQLSNIYRVKGDCARARTYLSAARAGAASPKELQDIKTVSDEIDRQCPR